jgi:hypothetical protein
MRYRAVDLGLQPNCVTFSLCEQRESNQKENTPKCVAQPGGWVPCASHHLSAAVIDIHVERRSPRRPWRYAREMAAMLGHANGIEDQKQELATSRETGVRSAHHQILLTYPAFCVAEHRRDCGVERHGCRESLAGPWMALQGGPHNREKRRAPAAGRPRIRLAFFLVPSFLANQKR